RRVHGRRRLQPGLRHDAGDLRGRGRPHRAGAAAPGRLPGGVHARHAAPHAVRRGLSTAGTPPRGAVPGGRATLDDRRLHGHREAAPRRLSASDHGTHRLRAYTGVACGGTRSGGPSPYRRGMPTPARTRRPSSQPTRRGALALSGLAGLGVLAGLAGCTPADHEVPPQGAAPLPLPPLAPPRLGDGGRPAPRRARAGLAGCTPAAHEFPPQGTAPLPSPPLAPSRLVDGVRTFTLTAQTGESALIAGRPDVRTPTVGYDGAFLGPTVRMARGERVRVDIRNDLDVVTTLHWHGMHLPAEMDGGPHTPIGPAETRTVEWEVRQPAATLWYHPHPHGKTEEQVLKGLAGLVLV